MFARGEASRYRSRPNERQGHAALTQGLMHGSASSTASANKTGRQLLVLFFEWLISYRPSYPSPAAPLSYQAPVYYDVPRSRSIRAGVFGIQLSLSIWKPVFRHRICTTSLFVRPDN